MTLAIHSQGLVEYMQADSDEMKVATLQDKVVKGENGKANAFLMLRNTRVPHT
jgi:hypothetical protein